MSFKKTISLVLAVSLTACLCACAKTDSKKHIAVIAKAVNSDFWHNVNNGVLSAATEYNVSVTFEGPENEEDYNTQNALIDAAVKNGADAIVLSAIDYNKSVDTVNAAIREGVKVVTIDSDINSDAVSLFIGTDNVAAGKEAGKAAVDKFAADSQIIIGLVNYNANTDNGNLRERGFREYISAVSNARIVASVTAESNEQSATAAAEKLLNENPGINVIVGFNEWMTLGVGNAVKNLGLSKNVQAVGFDSNLISVSMLETGEMDALIVQNPFAIGYLGVEKATALISGENLPSDDIYTDVTTVTKDNLFDDNIQKILFRFK
ncbi:MAG: substrate-binding domain-containing protein [Acutalibacteraceae bacterium]|nr:substrate-binding domain-containing protein [Acutalibacteraceae bacterium]